MKKPIEELQSTAPEFQQVRFKELMKEISAVELNYREQKYLLWLCGWDQETVDTFLTIFQKIHNNQ